MGGATGECGGQNHILQVMTVAVSFFSVNYVVFERKPHKVLHLINAEPFAVVCTKMFCKEQICVNFVELLEVYVAHDRAPSVAHFLQTNAPPPTLGPAGYRGQ